MQSSSKTALEFYEGTYQKNVVDPAVIKNATETHEIWLMELKRSTMAGWTSAEIVLSKPNMKVEPRTLMIIRAHLIPRTFRDDPEAAAAVVCSFSEPNSISDEEDATVGSVMTGCENVELEFGSNDCIEGEWLLFFCVFCLSTACRLFGGGKQEL